MLAMADRNGEVQASLPGLADVARVTLEQAEAALVTLSEPDKHSRSKEFEGRRIAETDGGWVLLNHDKYRKKLSKADRDRQNAERQKRYRERKKAEAEALRTCRREITQAEAEAEAEADPIVSVTREGAPARGAAPVKNWRVPPDDWQPLPALVERARALGLDPDLELEKFRTFEQTRIPTDWNLPFKRWLLTAKPVAANGKPSAPRAVHRPKPANAGRGLR